MNVKLIAAATMAALISGAASAAGYHNSAYTDSEWYVIGAAGGSYSDSDLLKVDNSTRELCRSCTWKKTKTTYAGKVGFGKQVNQNLGFEAGLYYLGKHELKATYTYNPSDRHAKATTTSYMLAVDALGILPVTRKVDLFAKVGVGLVRTKLSITADSGFPTLGYRGKFSDSDTKNRLAPKVGLGMEWQMNRNWSLRTEYEGIFHAYEIDNEDGANTRGDYHLLTLGLKYKF